MSAIEFNDQVYEYPLLAMDGSVCEFRLYNSYTYVHTGYIAGAYNIIVYYCCIYIIHNYYSECAVLYIFCANTILYKIKKKDHVLN